MITHELQFTWRGGGVSIPKSVQQQADAEDNREITLTGVVTNLQVVFTIDISQLKMIFITCDKAATVKTNDSTTPQETITITANGVFQWIADQGVDIPFDGDVTTLFISKPGATNGTLIIKMLFDSTL